jgi:hypothetical protein
VQFGGEFDALAFATRQGTERLAQRKVIQTHIAHGLQRADHLLHLKEVERLLHAQGLQSFFKDIAISFIAEYWPVVKRVGRLSRGPAILWIYGTA